MARPRVTLKLATSLDGKIALANGESEWITGEAARAAGRELRAQHDAIAVGANTAITDNPQLTTRLGDKPDPIRVIFDSHARLSVKSNLARTARDVPVILFHDQGARITPLTELGVQCVPLDRDQNGLSIIQALQVLRDQQIMSLLLEGGGQLAASFLSTGVIDTIQWFRAPVILGGDGRSGIASLRLEKLDLAYYFKREEVREIGPDLMETYAKIR